MIDPSEDLRKSANPSEFFGTVPHTSESFRNFPQPSETFRNPEKASAKTEHHTLTVREVARHFEEAGVPRTERSITNWCQPNRHGVPRLDSFFDENEGRYYITKESVSRVVGEERAKKDATGSQPPSATEIPNRSDAAPRRDTESTDRMKELERQNRDLEIATRGKDYYLERLEAERGQYVEKLVSMSRYVGELESQVHQLGGAPSGDRMLPHGSETVGTISHADGTTREAGLRPGQR